MVQCLLAARGDAPGVLRQAAPSYDQWHTFAQRMRTHVGLKVELVGAEVRQHRHQVIDTPRITPRLPRQAPFAQLTGDFPGVAAVEEAHADDIETSVSNHLQLLPERPLEAVRTALLHGPRRLVDE